MMENKVTSKYQIIQPFLLAVMVILGIFLGRKIDESGTPETKGAVKNTTTIAKNNSILEEASKFIQARYIDSINMAQLNDRVLQSMVNQLDPFSAYIPAGSKNEPGFSSFEQAYGFTCNKINNRWYVSSIVPKSSSWRSNLQIGDQVMAINDTLVEFRSFSHWEDSVLRVKIIDNKTNQVVSVNRNDLEERKSVSRFYQLNDKIGYLKINYFGDNTYDEFITALDTLYSKNGARHFIIDLRDNPGGYLEECSRILNQLFKEKNILLATTNGRTVRRVDYKTDGRQLFDVERIIVLVNEGSASASEVFAGAIQDLDRGLVVGSHTYGKGLVQEQYMLSNGSAIRLSVSRFYLASGRTVDRLGTAIEKNKIYHSIGKKVIHAGNYIYPNINVSETIDDEYDTLLSGKIKEAILNLKIKGTKSSKDPTKNLFDTILRTKRKWSAAEKAQVLKRIKTDWQLALKDEATWFEKNVLNDPYIVASRKILK